MFLILRPKFDKNTFPDQWGTNAYGIKRSALYNGVKIVGAGFLPNQHHSNDECRID